MSWWWTSFLSVLVCAIPVSADDPSFQLLPAERLRGVSVYDRLVERTKERIVFSHDARFHVGAMVSVLPIPYEEAVAMVRSTSAAAFGEGSFVERKTEVFPHERPQVPQPPGHQRIEDENVARLSQLGISPGTRFLNRLSRR
jgi:hypothetical protein